MQETLVLISYTPTRAHARIHVPIDNYISIASL
jgi:hypothetical protein